MWLVRQDIRYAGSLTRRKLLLKLLEQSVLFDRVVEHGFGLGNGLLQKFAKHLLCIGVFRQFLLNGFAQARANHVRLIAGFLF